MPGNQMREHLWVLTSSLLLFPYLNAPPSALHSQPQCPHLALPLLSPHNRRSALESRIGLIFYRKCLQTSAVDKFQGHLAGTLQSQDLNPRWPPGKPEPRGCGGHGSFLLLSSCPVLWAAVVGKCRVINNSYINAKAAGREMSGGNGISNKYTLRNSARF